MSSLETILTNALIVAQETKGFEFQVFNPRSLDPAVLVQVLLGLAVLIGTLIYGVHRYKKWKSFKLFEEELLTLELDDESQNAFVDMVKRYQFDEPVSVIYSQRLFDEMAAKEMVKVLGSSGSVKSKEHFIDLVEEIRTKTYNPEWLRSKMAMAAEVSEQAV